MTNGHSSKWEFLFVCWCYVNLSASMFVPHQIFSSFLLASSWFDDTRSSKVYVGWLSETEWILIFETWKIKRTQHVVKFTAEQNKQARTRWMKKILGRPFRKQIKKFGWNYEKFSNIQRTRFSELKIDNLRSVFQLLRLIKLYQAKIERKKQQQLVIYFDCVSGKWWIGYAQEIK